MGRAAAKRGNVECWSDATLGWGTGGRYIPLRDDIASVAYWYQKAPTGKFPALPGKNELEII